MTLSWVGIAILVLCSLLVGTAIFGVLWAAGAWLASVVREAVAAVTDGRSQPLAQRPASAQRRARESEHRLPSALSDASADAL